MYSVVYCSGSFVVLALETRPDHRKCHQRYSRWSASNASRLTPTCPPLRRNCCCSCPGTLTTWTGPGGFLYAKTQCMDELIRHFSLRSNRFDDRLNTHLTTHNMHKLKVCELLCTCHSLSRPSTTCPPSLLEYGDWYYV